MTPQQPLVTALDAVPVGANSRLNLPTRHGSGEIRRRFQHDHCKSLFLSEEAFLIGMETAMSYVLGLKCKECGHRVPVTAVHVCEQCFGPYEVDYDYARMKGKVTRQSIEAGPKSL